MSKREKETLFSLSVSRTAVIALEVCTFTVRLRMQKNPRVFGKFYFFGERAEFDFNATCSEQDGARRVVTGKLLEARGHFFREALAFSLMSCFLIGSRYKFKQNALVDWKMLFYFLITRRVCCTRTVSKQKL
jgi:hypothetical protein